MNADDDRGPFYGNRKAAREADEIDSDDESSVESPVSETNGPLHLGPGFEQRKRPPERSGSIRSNTAIRKDRHPKKNKKERKKVKKQLRKSLTGNKGLEGLQDFSSTTSSVGSSSPHLSPTRNDQSFAPEHLKGMNQPTTVMSDDEESLASMDLFDEPKSAQEQSKTLLEAAIKAREQADQLERETKKINHPTTIMEESEEESSLESTEQVTQNEPSPKPKEAHYSSAESSLSSDSSAASSEMQVKQSKPSPKKLAPKEANYSSWESSLSSLADDSSSASSAEEMEREKQVKQQHMPTSLPPKKLAPKEANYSSSESSLWSSADDSSSASSAGEMEREQRVKRPSLVPTSPPPKKPPPPPPLPTKKLAPEVAHYSSSESSVRSLSDDSSAARQALSKSAPVPRAVYSSASESSKSSHEDAPREEAPKSTPSEKNIPSDVKFQRSVSSSDSSTSSSDDSSSSYSSSNSSDDNSRKEPPVPQDVSINDPQDTSNTELQQEDLATLLHGPKHLRGMNQPLTTGNNDEDSLGSADLFDAPKSALENSKPLLAAAIKARKQVDQLEREQKAKHLEGMNQPKTILEEDEESLGSTNLFDPPKSALAKSKPLLAAAIAAREQADEMEREKQVKQNQSPPEMYVPIDPKPSSSSDSSTSDDSSASRQKSSKSSTVPKKAKSSASESAKLSKEDSPRKDQPKSGQEIYFPIDMQYPESRSSDSSSSDDSSSSSSSSSSDSSDDNSREEQPLPQDELATLLHGPKHLRGMNQPLASMSDDEDSLRSIDLFDAPKSALENSKPLLAAAIKAREQVDQLEREQKAKHLEGMNQPKTILEEDEESLGSANLFDPPKSALAKSKPLLAAAKAAREQAETLKREKQAKETEMSREDAPSLVHFSASESPSDSSEEDEPRPKGSSHVPGKYDLPFGVQCLPTFSSDDDSSSSSSASASSSSLSIDDTSSQILQIPQYRDYSVSLHPLSSGESNANSSQFEVNSMASGSASSSQFEVSSMASESASEKGQAHSLSLSQEPQHLRRMNQPSTRLDDDEDSLGSHDLFDPPKSALTKSKPLLAAAIKAREQAEQQKQGTQAKHLEGMNQPRTTVEEDENSLGSNDLFDPPKSAVAKSKPLLAAAIKVREQAEQQKQITEAENRDPVGECRSKGHHGAELNISKESEEDAEKKGGISKLYRFLNNSREYNQNLIAQTSYLERALRNPSKRNPYRELQSTKQEIQALREKLQREKEKAEAVKRAFGEKQQGTIAPSYIQTSIVRFEKDLHESKRQYDDLLREHSTQKQLIAKMEKERESLVPSKVVQELGMIEDKVQTLESMYDDTDSQNQSLMEQLQSKEKGLLIQMDANRRLREDHTALQTKMLKMAREDLNVKDVKEAREMLAHQVHWLREKLGAVRQDYEAALLAKEEAEKEAREQNQAVIKMIREVSSMERKHLAMQSLLSEEVKLEKTANQELSQRYKIMEKKLHYETAKLSNTLKQREAELDASLATRLKVIKDKEVADQNSEVLLEEFRHQKKKLTDRLKFMESEFDSSKLVNLQLLQEKEDVARDQRKKADQFAQKSTLLMERLQVLEKECGAVKVVNERVIKEREMANADKEAKAKELGDEIGKLQERLRLMEIEYTSLKVTNRRVREEAEDSIQKKDIAIKNAEMKIAELSIQVDSAEDNLLNVEKKLEESEAALADEKLTSEEKAIQAEELEAEISRLTDSVQRKMETIEFLEESNEKLESEKAEAEEQLPTIGELEEDKIRLTQSVEEKELLVEQLQSEIDALTEDLHNQENELHTLEQAADEMKMEKGNMEEKLLSDIDTLKGVLEGQGKEIEKLEQEAQTLAEEKSNLEKERDEELELLKEEITALKEDNARLEDASKIDNEQIEALLEEIDGQDQGSLLQARDEEIELLKEEIAALQVDKTQLEEASKLDNEQIEDLLEEVEALRENPDGSVNLSNPLKAGDGELETLREENAALQEEKARLEEASKIDSEQIEALLEEMESLHQDAGVPKDNMNLPRKWSEEIDSLRRELEILQDENDNLREASKIDNEQIEALLGEVEGRQVHHSVSDGHVNASKGRDEEVESLKKKIETLQNENTSLQEASQVDPGQIEALLAEIEDHHEHHQELEDHVQTLEELALQLIADVRKASPEHQFNNDVLRIFEEELRLMAAEPDAIDEEAAETTGDEAFTADEATRNSSDETAATSTFIVPTQQSTESLGVDENQKESSQPGQQRALRSELANMSKQEKDEMLVEYEVEIKELESILEAAKSDLEHYAEESSDLKEHIAVLNDKLAAQGQQLDALMQEKQSYLDQKEKLRNNLDNADRSLDNLRTKQKEEIESLTQQHSMVNTQERIAQLEEQLRVKEKELAEATNREVLTLKESNEMCEKLAKELQEKTEETDKIRKELSLHVEKHRQREISITSIFNRENQLNEEIRELKEEMAKRQRELEMNVAEKEGLQKESKIKEVLLQNLRSALDESKSREVRAFAGASMMGLNNQSHQYGQLSLGQPVYQVLQSGSLAGAGMTGFSQSHKSAELSTLEYQDTEDNIPANTSTPHGGLSQSHKFAELSLGQLEYQDTAYNIPANTSTPYEVAQLKSENQRLLSLALGQSVENEDDYHTNALKSELSFFKTESQRIRDEKAAIEALLYNEAVKAKRLQSEIEMLAYQQTRSTAVDEEIAALKREKSSLEGELRETKMVVVDLERKLHTERIQESNATSLLNQQIALLESEKRAIEIQLTSMSETLRDLESELDHMKPDVARAEDLGKEVSVLKEENQRLNDAKSSLEGQLQKTTIALTNLEGQLQIATSHQSKENLLLKQQMTHIESEKTAIERQLSRKNAVILDLESQVDRIRPELSRAETLHREITILRGDHQKLNDAKDSLEKDLSSKELLLAKLGRERKLEDAEKANEIRLLNRKLQHLESEKAIAEKHLKSKNENLLDLESRLEQLQAELSRARSLGREIAMIKKENDDLNDEKSLLEEHLKEAMKSVKELERQVHVKDSERSNEARLLNHKIEDLESEKASIKSKLESKNQEFKDLQSRLERLQSELSKAKTLSHEISEIKAENEQLNEDKFSLQKRLKKNNAIVDDFEQQLREKETEASLKITNLKHHLAKLEKEKIDAETKADGRLRDLESRLEEIQPELSRADVLNDENSVLIGENQRLNDSKVSLEEKLKDTTNSVIDLERQLQLKETQKSEEATLLNRTIAHLESEKVAIEAKLKSKNNVLEDLESELERLQAKVSKADTLSQENFESLSREITEVKEENQRLHDIKSSLEAQLEAQRKDVAKRKTGWKILGGQAEEPSQVEELEQQLGAKGKEMEKMKHENDKLAAEQDKMRGTIKKQMEILRGLKTDLKEEVEQEISDLVQENELLEGQLKKAKNVAVQLRLDLKQTLKAHIDNRLESVEKELELSQSDDYDNIDALQKEVNRLQNEQAKVHMQRKSVEKIKADLEREITREISSVQKNQKSNEEVFEEKNLLAKEVEDLKELLSRTTADLNEAKLREEANLERNEVLEKELELLRSEHQLLDFKSTNPHDDDSDEDLAIVKRQLQEQRELAERLTEEMKTLMAQKLETLKQSNKATELFVSKPQLAKKEIKKLKKKLGDQASDEPTDEKQKKGYSDAKAELNLSPENSKSKLLREQKAEKEENLQERWMSWFADPDTAADGTS